MRRLPIALATGLAALAAAVTVHARGVNITFTGVTLRGSDDTGVLTATDLFGAPFSVVYRLSGPFIAGDYFGGAGTSASTVGAVASIHGHVYSLKGDANALAARGNYAESFPGFWEIYALASDHAASQRQTDYLVIDSTVENNLEAQTGPIDPAFAAPLPPMAGPSLGGNGFLDIHRVHYAPTVGSPTSVVIFNTHVEFTVHAVTVIPAPESTAWALMLLGLGLTGAAVRRASRISCRSR